MMFNNLALERDVFQLSVIGCAGSRLRRKLKNHMPLVQSRTLKMAEPKDVEPDIPGPEINPDKVCFVIAKARELEAEDEGYRGRRFRSDR